MDKSLRTSLWKGLTAALVQAFPSLTPYKEKTKYIWPGELVFSSPDLVEGKTAFVIISADAKGRDQITVELAWSSTGRFPELVVRPSDVPARNEHLLTRPQAAVRLFSLGDPNADSRMAVTKDGIDRVIERTISELQLHGLPYLKRVRAA
ncbi:MAG TPA: hypothetical protein VFL64_04925 [Rhizobacter sp.]|nr:hypothetical protein [Rhizobacter sp.]